MRWRLLLSPPSGGPDNMALDEALMQRARSTGEAVFRVYGWAAPVLSLGRNQRARDTYDDLALARHGVSVVRRPTGGRALLHYREVTYSVTAPALESQPLGAVYSRINTLLVDALTSLGVSASIAEPATRALEPGAQPCFAEPARGEIVVGGRKLAGSAQWRDDGALLQHGSIIVDDDQSLIPSLMREGAVAAPRPATLRECLARVPALGEVAEALFAAVRRREDGSATELDERDISAMPTAAFVARYRDPTWTWRR